VRRRVWIVLVVLVVGTGAGLLLAGSRLDAAGSTLSRGGSGWAAMRAYLARRGTATTLVDRPLAEVAETGGTIVVAFPWQSRPFDLDRDALVAHLGRGGDVLIAYAAEQPLPSPAERVLLSALGVELEPVKAKPPLVPWRWRAQASTPWPLRPAERWRTTSQPAPSAGAGPALAMRPPRWLPELEPDDALLVTENEVAVAAAWKERRGRVVLLPADLLANGRLRQPAHAALLETLRGWLAPPWRFDEYHHGLGTTSPDAAPTVTQRGLDLLLLQLLLVYLMGALALSRRLGPAWRETPPLAGSAGGFLLRLGAFHHRLGHYAEGAALLLRRAAELDRRLPVSAGLRQLAERGDAASLVEVGQTVARLQRH
jgi:hypothetical protein